jgi:photosystem II stability/assembly factor-like uncharacterized protein
MKAVGAVLLSFLLLAVLPASARVRAAAWSVTGPEGGEVLALALDRAEPQTVYAATNAGIFKSTTGGESWVRASAGLPDDVDAIELDQSRPQVLYAATSKGVWKSVDGGQRWVRLETPASNPVALAVAPSAPQTVYALVPFRGWWGPSTIWRSTNGGRTWIVRSSKAPDARLLAVDPASPGTLYLGSGRGVFRSEDGGRTWQRRLTQPVASLLADPASRGTVYAGGYAGRVYASATGNFGWRKIADLHDTGRVTALAVDADGQVLWAGTSKPYQGKPYQSTDTAKLYRSGDSGRTWTREASSLGSTITAIAAGSSTLAASDLGIWKSVGDGVEPANAGLVATSVTTIATDPARPLVAYAKANWTIYATTDGGASWQVASQLPVNGADPIELAVDPRRPSTVYAAVLVFPGPWSGFVAKSTDGARTWRVVKPGIKAVSVAVSRSRPNVVYAGALGEGVFRSTDGGATWARCGTGPPARLGHVAVDPRQPDTVYAGTWEWKGGPKGTVYRSTDGGATWQAAVGLPTSAVNDLAVDPHRPQTIYAAMVAGLYRSDDRGTSWRRVAGGMQHVIPDPQRADVVYATNRASLFVTRNGGRTWQTAGVPSRPSALAVSARATRIFVGTGKGVAVAPLPLDVR